jgi:hypothetical protein
MTHETSERFVTLAIFDFESKSAQKRSEKKLPRKIGY